MAAVIRLVGHLDREGGAGWGGEGAGLAGAAGVVVGALGGGQPTGAGAEVRRTGVPVVVVMGVRRAGPRCGPSLEGEDGAVRRRRCAGLGSHLLIGGQLQGSQETCSKILQSF